MNRVLRAIVHAEEQENLAHKNRRGQCQGEKDEPLLTLSSAGWKCLNNSNASHCIAFSPQKTMLAVGCRDGRIEIWDNVSLRVIKALLDPLHSIKTSKEGRKEFEFSETQVSLEKMQLVSRQRNLKKVSHDAQRAYKYVMTCAWSCDSRRIFSGCEGLHHKSHLCVWDVATATLIMSISFPSSSITHLSSHPRLPNVVMLCHTNNEPLWLDLDTNVHRPCQYPYKKKEESDPTLPAKSRGGRCSAIFGSTGDWTYVTTSDGYVAIYQSSNSLDTALPCVSAIQTSVAIQTTCISCNKEETALLVTCVKGLLELAIVRDERDVTEVKLSEVRLYSSGAVRVPWSVCCFSGVSEMNVMGIPALRQRHVVGENAIYEWNRQNGSAYHGVGVKEGLTTVKYVSAALPDEKVDSSQHLLNQDTIFAISSSGSLYVYENAFKTGWHGSMYPPGFRVVTDNEVCNSPLLDSEDQFSSTPVSAEPELLESSLSVGWEKELSLLPSIPVQSTQSRIEDTEPISPVSFGLEHSVFKPHQGSPTSVLKLLKIERQKRKKEGGVNKARKLTSQRRPRL